MYCEPGSLWARSCQPSEIVRVGASAARVSLFRRSARHGKGGLPGGTNAERVWDPSRSTLRAQGGTGMKKRSSVQTSVPWIPSFTGGKKREEPPSVLPVSVGFRESVCVALENPFRGFEFICPSRVRPLWRPPCGPSRRRGRVPSRIRSCGRSRDDSPFRRPRRDRE